MFLEDLRKEENLTYYGEWRSYQQEYELLLSGSFFATIGALRNAEGQ